jgi:hypothetical protein
MTQSRHTLEALFRDDERGDETETVARGTP